jgi:hypothetical protein
MSANLPQTERGTPSYAGRSAMAGFTSHPTRKTSSAWTCSRSSERQDDQLPPRFTDGQRNRREVPHRSHRPHHSLCSWGPQEGESSRPRPSLPAIASFAEVVRDH